MSYVQELRDATLTKKPRRSGPSPEVWIKVVEAETLFNVEPATLEAPAGEQAKGDGEAGESPPIPDSFWKIQCQADKGDGVGCLTLLHTELAVPVACVQIKDAGLRAGGRKPGGTITVWVPFLTNLEELRRGDPLWYKKHISE